MKAPPTFMPCRSEIGAELTPGSRSSGKITCSRAFDLRGLTRLFLVDHRGRERRRADIVCRQSGPPDRRRRQRTVL